jgi:hypothetical protein
MVANQVEKDIEVNKVVEKLEARPLTGTSTRSKEGCVVG